MSIYRGPSSIGTSTDTVHSLARAAAASALDAANSATDAIAAQLASGVSAVAAEVSKDAAALSATTADSASAAAASSVASANTLKADVQVIADSASSSAASALAIFGTTAEMTAVQQSTTANAAASASDRTQTGLDRTAVASSASAAASSATSANSAASAASTSAAAAVVSQTASSASEVAANTSKLAAASSASSANTSEVNAAASLANVGSLESSTQTHANAAYNSAVATAADRVATAADRASVTLDRITTNNDRLQTGVDRAAVSASVSLAAGSAAAASVIYGTTNAMQDALNTAAAQSQLAQTAAASASSILSQDLSAVSAALHRSPNAVTAMCIYDTAGDTDGGAWVDRMGHTSWMNEPLCGTWLPGGFSTELAARGDNLLTHAEGNVASQAGSMVTDAAVSIIGYAASIQFGDNSVNRWAYRSVALAAAAPMILTVVVQMDDNSVPVVSTNTSTGDFLLTMFGNVLLTPSTVTSLGGNRYLVTAQVTTGASGNIGVVKYAGQSAKGFRVTAMKLNKVGELPSTYSASPELVSNGGFDNGTVGWAIEATSSMSVANGVLRIDRSINSGNASTTISTVAGKAYSISADVTVGSVAGIVIVNGVILFNGSGKASATFVAAGSTSTIELRPADISKYAFFDNISVKEVTTLATPYVPYSTQTNSYYQSSADGKFYKLGAGYGALTEVFRGNKAKFPRLAAIIAEAASVTIYDLTEKGQPMWMRFAYSQYANMLSGISTATSVSALNGILCAGASGTSDLSVVFFTKDSGKRYPGVVNVAGDYLGNIAGRNALLNFINPVTTNLIASRSVNAVALTVLPDAPFDVATGLQIPTIAVATAGGLSVIKSDGTVVNSASTSALISVGIASFGVSAQRTASSYSYAVGNPNSLIAGFVLALVGTNAAPDFVRWTGGKHVSGSRSELARYGDGTAMLQKMRMHEAAIAKSTAVVITNTFNSGHLLSDIKRAYLCNTEVESVTATELVTNGTFDVDTAGWVSSANATLTFNAGSGVVSANAAGTATVYQTLSGLAGKTVRISATYSGLQAGKVAKLSLYSTSDIAAASGTAASGTLTAVGYVPFGVTPSINMVFTSAVAGGESVTFDNISVKEVIPDRSYKAAGANIYGTLVKAPVA